MVIDSHGWSGACADLCNLSDQYQSSSRRFQQTRRLIRSHNAFDSVRTWSNGARWDGVLCRPEAVSSSVIRNLISLSRRLEELGEISADMSGFVEKYTFKILGGNESFGFKKLVASAIARSISSLARIGPLNAFKLVGCGLFALSVVASATALALNGGGLRQTQANRLGRPSKSRIIKKSLQKRTAEWLTRNISGVSRNPITRLNRSLDCASLECLMQNRKRQSPIVQALLTASLISFKVINKLFVSWDKHIAFHSAKLISPYMGNLLSTRITLCVFSGVAAAMTIVLDPINLSLSLIGIAACGVAALMAATALAIAKNQTNQVLGRVTPCWP